MEALVSHWYLSSNCLQGGGQAVLLCFGLDKAQTVTLQTVLAVEPPQCVKQISLLPLHCGKTLWHDMQHFSTHLKGEKISDVITEVELSSNRSTTAKVGNQGSGTSPVMRKSPSIRNKNPTTEWASLSFLPHWIFPCKGLCMYMYIYISYQHKYI